MSACSHPWKLTTWVHVLILENSQLEDLYAGDLMYFFFFLVMKRRGKENPNSLSILHLTYVTKENEVKVAFLEMQDLLYLTTLRPLRDEGETWSHWFCLLFPLLSCSHGCCRWHFTGHWFLLKTLSSDLAKARRRQTLGRKVQWIRS